MLTYTEIMSETPSISAYLLRCLREFNTNKRFDGRKRRLLLQNNLIEFKDGQYVLTLKARIALTKRIKL